MERKSFSVNNINKKICMECGVNRVGSEKESYCCNCKQELAYMTGIKLRKSSMNTAIEENPVEIPISTAIAFLQPDKRFCWFCTKKTKMNRFKCRCGFVFCKKCRMPEQHNCDFDYHSHGKQFLTRTNPKIAKLKLKKL